MSEKKPVDAHDELSHDQARRLIQQASRTAQQDWSLKAHLQNCAECRQFAAIHVHLRSQLNLTPARTKAPPELRAALQRRADQSQRRDLFMNPLKSALALAALAFVVIFAWSALRSISLPAELAQPTPLTTTDSTPEFTPESTVSSVVEPAGDADTAPDPNITPFPPTVTPLPDVVPPPANPQPGFGFGAQMSELDNANTLAQMNAAGMGWVKVEILFTPGDSVDSTAALEAVQSAGFQILVTVTGFRDDIGRGDDYFQEYADYVAQLAPHVDAIEIWSEPNLDRNWPTGQIDPVVYTELLRLSYEAVKAADATTLVINGAPAATGINNEAVMSDDRFIAGLIAAGAADYLDCAGMQYTMGATPPLYSTGHRDGRHYSYYFLDLVNLYWDTFNAGRDELIPLCFTSIGYLTADGFDQSLDEAGAGAFTWANGNSEYDQAIWLADALARSCMDGMVKLFIIYNMDFTRYGPDPQAGYALIRPDGSCLACERLAQAAADLRDNQCMP